MKKLISLVLAIAMIAMVGLAFAADEVLDNNVSVTGLAANDTTTFYQIVKWVGGDVDGNVAGWKAVEPFDSVLTEAVLKSVLIGDGTNAATGITAELAGRLAKVSGASGAAVAVSGGKAEKTISDANDAGIYMVIVTPGDADTIYSPVFVSADYNAGGNEFPVSTAASYSDSAAAKKSTLTIEKTAANASDYTPDNGKTVAVGDTLTFTVTTTIPGYGEVYTAPHFVLSDKLTALTLNEGSVRVDEVDAANYTLTTAADGYSIAFKDTYLKTLTAAKEITVTYTATVNNAAAYAINEKDNQVQIEYSHDPSDESDYNVKKDTTQHYTFSLDANALGDTTIEGLNGIKTSELVKTGVDANGNPVYDTKTTSQITDSTKEEVKSPLAGASFGLYGKDDPTCVGTALQTVNTGDDGRMNFAGLDAGTYYLKEISAPSGFIADTKIREIKIEAETEEITVTEYYHEGAWYPTAQSTGDKSATYKTNILKSYKVTVDGVVAADYTFNNSKTANSPEIQWTELAPVEVPSEIQNVQGLGLPTTGGMGTTILYIVGAMLIVGAGVILVTRRKATSK